MRVLSRRSAVVGTVITVVVASGVAWAGWTSDGKGTAGAKAGQAVSVKVTAASVTTLLYPGGRGDVSMTIQNPNSYAVKVTRVRWNQEPITAPGSPGCMRTGVTFPAKPAPNNPFTVVTSLPIPRGESRNLVLPLQASMGFDSDNGCQNATFSIPVIAEADMAE